VLSLIIIEATMNYKFAVIENCDATCWDERIGGFKTCESIIVIDVPPQKRLISFINSCETLLEFFISLPRMHFYSYIYGEKNDIIVTLFFLLMMKIITFIQHFPILIFKIVLYVVCLVMMKKIKWLILK
jgi:hypothetical protein